MRINFFEEYPNDENLEKARLIDFPSTVFLAAKSLEQFSQYKEKLLGINPSLDIGYWPIIPHTYWISPFSFTEDLQRLVDEIKNNKSPLSILVDLELPFKNNKFLYLRNLFSFSKNKKIIQNFFTNAKKYNINIVTAEYTLFSSLLLKIYRVLGISYNPKIYGHKTCSMYYTSMISSEYYLKKITKTLVYVRREINPELELGLGTIATGVLGNEPILTANNLDRDLTFMKLNGFETATIFRLGGLNQEYTEVIKRYI